MDPVKEGKREERGGGYMRGGVEGTCDTLGGMVGYLWGCGMVITRPCLFLRGILVEMRNSFTADDADMAAYESVICCLPSATYTALSIARG